MARYPDPTFPLIAYRRGAAGQPVPVLRGTGLRVQAVILATTRWGMTPAQVADEYGINEAQVREALAFYHAHRQEIDANLVAEQALEAGHGQA